MIGKGLEQRTEYSRIKKFCGPGYQRLPLLGFLESGKKTLDWHWGSETRERNDSGYYELDYWIRFCSTNVSKSESEVAD